MYIYVGTCCDGFGFICNLINDTYLLHFLYYANLCAKEFLSPLFVNFLLMWLGIMF